MEGAEKFLGVSLAAEKELVLIVVRHEQKNDVMTAIMEDAGLESRAKAVFFAARHEHGGPAPDRPDRRHRITAHESRSGSQNAVYRRVGGLCFPPRLLRCFGSTQPIPASKAPVQFPACRRSACAPAAASKGRGIFIAPEYVSSPWQR